MKSHGLARVVPPTPPPKPVCAACKCYAPEVIVPYGEGAVELCWLCAHHHVDHGVPLSECADSQRCEHAPGDIYPDRGRHPLSALMAGDIDRGEAIARLEAQGMPRQEAKAMTFGMDAGSCGGMAPMKLTALAPKRKGLHEPVDEAHSVAVARGMRAARRR